MVGPAASGKTTLRRQLLALGLPAGQVVSLDDLRRAVAAEVVGAGGPSRAPQDWSAAAVRRATADRAALLAAGRGYLADATHLRRRERVDHVRAAQLAGLPAVAVLLPEVSADVLLARNAARDAADRVPTDVLLRHVHRRSLLSRELLLEEGFDLVLEADRGSAERVTAAVELEVVAPATRPAPAGDRRLPTR